MKHLCWILMCYLISTSMLQAESIPNVIDGVQPKVVKLFGAGGLKNLAGYGSGFLVSADGHIVTVWSHLLDSDVVTVVLSDGQRFYGEVLGTDSRLDLAIIKIDSQNLPHFDLKQAVSVGPGARVLAFSNMFKVATGDEPLTVVHGVVSSKTELSAKRGRYKVPYSGPVYLTDAITNNSGAAGGVLTTYDGKLLAMLGRELQSEESNTWINYAMPIPELQGAIEDIIAGKFTRRDPLTSTNKPEAMFSTLDFGIVLVPNVVFRTPAYIEAIQDDSPAAKQGLKPDDLIVFANGELVNSIQNLEQVFAQAIPGDDLQLIIRRNEELITVTFPIPRK